MDQHLITALITALEASDLEELEYSKDGATLRLVKAADPTRTRSTQAPLAKVLPTTPVRPPMPASPAVDGVVAPLYGIVHLQRAPGAAPFVTPGQTVEAGEVLCMIEAMKAFTDVCASQAGQVTEVLVATSQEVDAGQVLFRMTDAGN